MAEWNWNRAENEPNEPRQLGYIARPSWPEKKKPPAGAEPAGAEDGLEGEEI
jgi:hypothetical protein